MPTLFAKIIAGEITCHKIAENENCFAFLDINPLRLGHVLVIPKREVDYIFDLTNEEYSSLWLFANQIAKAIKKVVVCKKVGIAVIGLEVPHAHIHLVPIDYVGDINFSLPKLKPAPSELEEIATKIANHLIA
jgi:histidine triad (HIT) family protein